MISLLILDKDKEYGSSLGKAISNLHSEFHVSISSIEDHYDTDITKNFDLFLIGGYSQNELDGLNLQKDRMLRLVEEQVEDLNEQLAYNEEQIKKGQVHKVLQVNKYSRVSDLVSELRFLYGVFTGKKDIIKTDIDTNIIGFYSASGGTGKTVISISIARELSRYHDKKVLYLCLDEISATTLYLRPGSAKRNLGDYLYYLFEKKNENICSIIECFTFSDEYGVNAFYPSGGRNELRQLTKEELTNFIKVILNSNCYDYLILDLGSHIDEETILLLEYCSKVILIEDESHMARYKNKKLMKYMDKINSSQFAKKLISVVNKVEPNDQDEISEPYTLQQKNIIEIERDDNSFYFKDGCVVISINHVFGLGIKKIADEILHVEACQIK